MCVSRSKLSPNALFSDALLVEPLDDHYRRQAQRYK